jgi:hypothetical protein
MSETPARKSYSAYYAVSVEGARIGIVTCLRCGAALILDEERAAELHDEWHRRIVVTE